jgi:hypothetical protein
VPNPRTVGLQALATWAVAPATDLKWIYLGCVVPDLPWMLQRIGQWLLQALAPPGAGAPLIDPYTLQPLRHRAGDAGHEPLLEPGLREPRKRARPRLFDRGGQRLVARDLARQSRKRGCIVVIDEDRCWPAHEASSVRAAFRLRTRLGLTSNQ